MKRREFVRLLGGAVAAWPLEARAQQAERMRHIGVLLPATADDTEFQTRVGARFRVISSAGLYRHRWVDELRIKPCGSVSPDWPLCGPHSQGRETR